MPTSLARQLASIAEKSRSSLNVKAQRAAHSRSLIWDPIEATAQSFESLHVICAQGFDELCRLDRRFYPFAGSIFSPESRYEDRNQLTAARSAELDHHLESFLRLVGGRLHLMPAIKALEWLIRRFRIHEHNARTLLTTFLPYHSAPVFVTLLSVLPSKLPPEFQFLAPYARSLTAPPRGAIVQQAFQNKEFLATLTNYTFESCRIRYHYPALVSFWGSVTAEAINSLIDRQRSGRRSIQSAGDQDLLIRFGPDFASALMMKKVPDLQVASYMVLALFVSKACLQDAVLTAFMEQLVLGWSTDTIRPGLLCLSIIAQHRTAARLSTKVLKAMLKVDSLGDILEDMAQSHPVDRLAGGFCLATIDRLARRGDPRGLPILARLLCSPLMRKTQAIVIIKSLLIEASRICAATVEQNQDGDKMRQGLAVVLTAIADLQGETGELLGLALEGIDVDIERLEMSLHTTLRPALSLTANGDASLGDGIGDTPSQHPSSPTALDAQIVRAEMARLAAAASKGALSAHISRDPGALSAEFSRLFVSAVTLQASEPSLLVEFNEMSPLRRKKVFRGDITCIAFYSRIWCGPYPALVRTAALRTLTSGIYAAMDAATDVQILLPYNLSALVDPSKTVRRAAADLITCLSKIYQDSSKVRSMALADGKTPYGQSIQTAATTQMSPDLTGRLICDVLAPVLEECVMHCDHAFAVLLAALESPSSTQQSSDATITLQVGPRRHQFSQQARLQLLSFLSEHVVQTPYLVVKERLLTVLNQLRGVSSVNRTQFLLPVLQWWARLDPAEATALCTAQSVSESKLDERCVDVTVPNDKAGLSQLLGILGGISESNNRAHLGSCVLSRIRKMWPSMKPSTRDWVARELFSLSQTGSATANEAAGVLRAVELATETLAHFLDLALRVQIAGKDTEPAPRKRRRVSSEDSGQGQIPSDVVGELADVDLGPVLKRIGFVLQLVETAQPERHLKLFDQLFKLLSELQHFRTVVKSELGFLQSLVLRCLLSMMPALEADTGHHMDSSGGHGEILIQCIQRSSSPTVQNAALLLIASLARAAPQLVLNSLMPMFTFMGASVMRQSDSYSAHVVSQTITQVIPPLMDSLRHGHKCAVTGAADLLSSFAIAYEHIPTQHRMNLFTSLVETLGPSEFLFAIIAMLVDRNGSGGAIVHFAADLLGLFSVEIQLLSLLKILDLIADIFSPQPGLSLALLTQDNDVDHDNSGGRQRESVKRAQKQLLTVSSLLASPTLKSHFRGLSTRDDMEASTTRELYASLMERVLLLTDTVKADKPLHGQCGATVAALLNLLPISEFVRSIESLLERPGVTLRLKALRTLELRVGREPAGDPQSATALLSFLPQLTALIRDASDIKSKHTAVTCVDCIAEKYGHRDVEVVAAAAATIAGPHCLDQADRNLQFLSLLCLASITNTLKVAILPVLPLLVPRAFDLLVASISAGGRDPALHSACLGVLTALAHHLPYMMSPYVARLLAVCNTSAQTFRPSHNKDDVSDVNDSRVVCLRIFVTRLEPVVVFSGLEGNWSAAVETGFSAVGEFVALLNMALEYHPKSAVAKNLPSLTHIFLGALSLRQQTFAKGNLSDKELGQLEELEQSINDAILKMIEKLNDLTFQPVFTHLVECLGQGEGAVRSSTMHHRYTVWGFLHAFFSGLQSIVTNYAAYVVDDAAKALTEADLDDPFHRALWRRCLAVLTVCFKHDQSGFWQTPAHFSAIAPTLTQQLARWPVSAAAATADDDGTATTDLVEAVVGLASASDSAAHHKELNQTLLRLLRHSRPAVRLAAIHCQLALVDRLGEEWLAALPEMLPYIGELLEDDDEPVERATARWIANIEAVLGESLDSMLQ